MFTRRSFLYGSGAVGAGALAGLPRLARATQGPANKVLEVFCRGGMSPWRSFFYEPTLSGLESPAPDWTAFSPQPTTTPLTWMHNDTLGESAHPLHTAGLMDRCRVVVMHHELEPHEAAVPFALTGTRLGRPKFSGLAAAVNHHHGDPLAAIVLDTGDGMAAGHAAAYNATYGAQSRPVVVRMGDDDLLTTLGRTSAARTNGIKGALLDAYRVGLEHHSHGTVRSAGFEAYDAAMTTLIDHSPALLALLSSTSYGEAVAGDWTSNLTRQALRVATELLAIGTVWYVCVIDNGVYLNYDSHDDESNANQNQAGNLWNVCSELGDLYGEGRLDDVTVAINTEFGRKEDNGTASGTEHWPWGYTGVILSPHYADAKQRGDIDGDGLATAGAHGRGPYNPTDLRCALAYRAGVEVELLLDLDELSHPNDPTTILDELL